MERGRGSVKTAWAPRWTLTAQSLTEVCVKIRAFIQGQNFAALLSVCTSVFNLFDLKSVIIYSAVRGARLQILDLYDLENGSVFISVFCFVFDQRKLKLMWKALSSPMEKWTA